MTTIPKGGQATPVLLRGRSHENGAHPSEAQGCHLRLALGWGLLARGGELTVLYHHTTIDKNKQRENLWLLAC
jgi:hypothetical protein